MTEMWRGRQPKEQTDVIAPGHENGTCNISITIIPEYTIAQSGDVSETFNMVNYDVVDLSDSAGQNNRGLFFI